MQLQVPADLEALINKRLATGGYDSAEDVLRDALETQDAYETTNAQERLELSAFIEERYRQSENCELIDEAEARRKMEAMKAEWLAARQ
jgi:Arc/MetJ-type ribon-helix-helix transcriptional regulator